MVELMIGLGIVAILSTMGVQGMRQRLAQARSVEALTTVGAIGRAVQVAANRDRTNGALLSAGALSFQDQGSSKVTGSTSGNGNGKGATVTHNPSGPGLCGDSTSVPASFTKVTGKKYQPSSAVNTDYNTGDSVNGWKCLRFTLDSPQYYQYSYAVGGPPVDVKLPHGGTPSGLSEDYTFTVTARGDVDADGTSSWFVLEGYVTDAGEVIQAPWIGTQDPEE